MINFLLWFFVYIPIFLGVWHMVKFECKTPMYPLWFHYLAVKNKDWHKLKLLLKLNWHCFWMEIRHPYWLYYTRRFLWWVGYKIGDWISKG